MKLPNIKYIGDVSKFVEAKDDPHAYIMMNKDEEYLMDNKAFEKFVTGCERYVRTSDDYKAYINWIKSTVGIKFCQVSSKIVSSKRVEIEMHHGPIFTIYDCISCAIDFRLKRNLRVNTFTVADQVLQDHFDCIISVVMLAKTYHEAVHNRDIFLNINQQLGNMKAFLDKYGECLDDQQKYKLYNYMKMSKNNQSFDTGILTIDNVKPYIDIDQIDKI